jgi:hypothetical protein
MLLYIMSDMKTEEFIDFLTLFYPAFSNSAVLSCPMPAYPPFQEWVIQLISMISSILLGIAAIYGIASLWVWRRSLRRRTKLELARRIILLAQQFQDEFHNARSVLAAAEESANRNRMAGEQEAESIVLDEWFVHNRRIQALQTTLHKLREAAWEATTVFGPAEAKLMQPFEDAYRELSVAISLYFRARHYNAQKAANGHGNGNSEDTMPITKQMRDTIYGVSDDAFARSVIDAVNALKDKLRPYIR